MDSTPVVHDEVAQVPDVGLSDYEIQESIMVENILSSPDQSNQASSSSSNSESEKMEVDTTLPEQTDTNVVDVEMTESKGKEKENEKEEMNVDEQMEQVEDPVEAKQLLADHSMDAEVQLVHQDGKLECVVSLGPYTVPIHTATLESCTTLKNIVEDCPKSDITNNKVPLDYEKISLRMMNDLIRYSEMIYFSTSPSFEDRMKEYTKRMDMTEDDFEPTEDQKEFTRMGPLTKLDRDFIASLNPIDKEGRMEDYVFALLQNCATFLDHSLLVDILTSFVAEELTKCANPEAIRHMFKLPDDLTEEQKHAFDDLYDNL